MKDKTIFAVSLKTGIRSDFNVISKSYSDVEAYFGLDEIFQISKCNGDSRGYWAIDLTQDGKLIKTE